jgi:hypothetical protein
LGKLQHDKVDHFLLLSTVIFSIIRFYRNIVRYIQIKAKAYARHLFIEHYKDFRREREFLNFHKQKSRNPTKDVFSLNLTE